MGIKISIYDNNGNRLNSDSLLGVNFTLNGTKYYPRIDGTVRICTAEKVSNVLSRIKVDTANNTVLATGDYDKDRKFWITRRNLLWYRII